MDLARHAFRLCKLWFSARHRRVSRFGEVIWTREGPFQPLEGVEAT